MSSLEKPLKRIVERNCIFKLIISCRLTKLILIYKIYFILYIIKMKDLITIIILVLDSIMIGYVLNKQWSDTVTNVQKSQMKIKPLYAVITYIFVILGIYLFVYPKLTEENWVVDGLKWGFLWGVIVYGIFDFTNLSIFENYSLKTAIMDTLWGGFLTSIAVLLTYLTIKNI